MARNVDNYDPNNSIAPAGGQGDYLTTQANPSQTGGKIAQAVEGFGQQIEKSADDQFKIGLMQQGLANEHAATIADQQLAVDGGKIYEQYKSYTGLDASNMKDKAVADYTALSNKIREGLGNPAAQRAYDQFANRRLSFAIQDINSYASTQKREAYKNGRLASITLAKEQASRPEVAGNPAQFNDSLAEVIFSANDVFTNPEFGMFRTISATTDPKTGLLKYDTSTTDGQVSQKSYDAYIQKESGDVFTNAAKTLAVDNPMKAHDFIESNKNRMSSATYANLSHSIAPAVQAETVRKGVDDIFNDFTAEYQNNPTVGSPVDTVKSLFPGVQITSTTRTPEKNASLPGSSPTSHHLTGNAVDLVAPPGVSLDEIKSQLTAKGFNIIESTDVKDNPQTGEKAHYHIAWEPKVDASNPSYTNALGANSPKLIQQARQWAIDNKLSLTEQDQAEARMQTRISHILTAEQYANRANEDEIVRDIYAGKFPNQEALDRDPRFQTLSSRNSILAGNIVTRIMPAMARGMQNTYGPDFYSHLVDALHGKADVTSISNYVGMEKNSPITNSGFKAITPYLNHDKPEDLAFYKAFGDYLDREHGFYTGSKQMPGVSPTETNESWDKALAEILPRVQAGRASGKTADQMFNPDSKDYIKPGVKAPKLADLMLAHSRRKAAGLTREAPEDYKSVDDLLKALKAKGPSFRPEFDKIAVEKGWAQATPPKVPFNP